MSNTATMDIEDPSTLLWAEQLKREHKYLLQRINILESNSTTGVYYINSREKSRVAILEQKLASTLEGNRKDCSQLKDELNLIETQLETFCANFSLNFKQAFARQIQQTGLVTRISEISKKVDFLNAEIEDDALALTSTRAKIQRAQEETTHLVDRIFSVEHWVAKLKGSIDQSNRTRSSEEERLQQIFRKLDSVVQANEAIGRGLAELEHAVARLQQQQRLSIDTKKKVQQECSRVEESCLDRNQSSLAQSHEEDRARDRASAISVRNQQTDTKTAQPDTMLHKTQYGPFVKGRDQVGRGSDHKHDSLTNGSYSGALGSITQSTNTSMNGSLATPQCSKAMQLTDGEIYTVQSFCNDQEEETEEVESEAAQISNATEIEDFLVVTDGGGRLGEPEIKPPRGLVPESSAMDEKFWLPVTLPGRQTRSKTRAAVALEKGYKAEERHCNWSCSRDANQNLTEIFPAGSVTLAAQGMDLSPRDPKRTGPYCNRSIGESVTGSQPIAGSNLPQVSKRRNASQPLSSTSSSKIRKNSQTKTRSRR